MKNYKEQNIIAILERLKGDIMEKQISETRALTILKSNYKEAGDILEDQDKLEHLLERLEEKLKSIPAVGDKLSEIPVWISLVRSYMKGEYKEIPIGSLVAIVAAMIYVVAPLDLIPDTIPVAGYLDDTAVVVACLKLVETDVVEYKEWKKNNSK